MEVLKSHGHEVIPFSIKSKRNRASEYEPYFLDTVGDDAVYFGDYDKKNVKTVVKTFSRMFYSFEAKTKLDKLIKDTRPDLVYVLHYQNKISASIFDAARQNNVPVVHRISDFGQICTNALFFRPIQKDICERCLHGSNFNAVINKCVYNSYLYSSLKAAALQLQQLLNIKKKVAAFIVPSKFTLSKLAEGGFSNEKLFNIPTFFNFPPSAKDVEINYKPFAVYIGRIEAEKGLFTLVKAFENTNFNLKIIGFSATGYDVELQEYLKDKQHNIEFLGKMEFEQIQGYLADCSFTVVPSEWYDNFPNTILESFAFKKSVIATNTGSLKEIVLNKNTGLLFELKDEQDLKEKVTELFNNTDLCMLYGNNAYNMITTEFSADSHYSKLIQIFNNVVNKTSNFSTNAVIN